MLPDGWKEKIFGDIVRNTQLGTTKRGADINLDHNLNLVKMGNLLWGSLDLSNVEKLSSNQLDGDYLLKKGDFLFNTRNTPELVGKSAAWKENSGSYCYDNNINRITFSNDADPFYMEYYLNFGSGKKSVRALASGSTSVAAIYWKGLKNLRIILPPLPEQKKIAAILSTWDRAIEGTEKLLANSQKQKKALMQQLLTGKKRLPGFTGEWLCHKLGEIAGFLKGKGLSKADINPTGKTPCIHYGSLFTEQPSIITETKTLTNTFKGAVFSKKNDVLMPTSDVTPAGLAVASAIQKDNVLLGNDILIIRPNSERLYGPFLSRIIRNSKKKILSFATGTTVFHLYASDMKGFQLLVPPVPEQKAIAAVLSTADEEITALESDLSRLRQEKKALMQQLLTGKIRVAV